MPLDWFEKEHDFEERNELYIKHAVDFGVQAVESCLQGENTLNRPDSRIGNRCYFLHFQ